jgi:hypothetical protein
MEDFFQLIIFSALVVGIVGNVFFILKTQKIEKAADHILKEYPELLNSLMETFGEVQDKIDHLSDKIEQIDIALLKKAADAASQTKPNNWDSVREAFKVPTKIEVNERN